MMKNYVAVVGALLLGSYSATAGVLKLSELDTDRDGKISRIEADKSPELKMLFDRADANGDGDGYLDRAEFQTAQEWMRQRDRGQTRDQPRAQAPKPLTSPQRVAGVRGLSVASLTGPATESAFGDQHGTCDPG